MKISIITPSYNQGAFVERCFASVKGQEGDFAVEHIVLDNCSTDQTVEALTEYRAQPGRVELKLFVERDAGQTAAINRGFELAGGDIVCWLNTDEWYRPGALAKVAAYFRDHPDTDVLFGDCEFVDAAGRVLKRRREFTFSHSMLVFYGCYIPSCSTFVRRQVLDAGIRLNPEFKIVMDTDWYARISRAGYRFDHLPEVLASFTWHETNISKSFPERKQAERRLIADQHGGIKGPAWLRGPVYELLRCYWLGVRLSRRIFASTLAR